MTATRCELLSMEQATPTNHEPAIRRMEPATREDLAQLEATAAASALLASLEEDAHPVPIRYGGRVIMAQPINARRFVLAMARFVSLN